LKDGQGGTRIGTPKFSDQSLLMAETRGVGEERGLGEDPSELHGNAEGIVPSEKREKRACVQTRGGVGGGGGGGGGGGLPIQKSVP